MPGTTTTRNNRLPFCGKCGYPARGIESLNCPECGADLREVGIVDPNRRRFISKRMLTGVLYTACIFILTLPFSQPFSESIPMQLRKTQTVVMSPGSDTFRVVALTLERDLSATPHQRWQSSNYELLLDEELRYTDNDSSTIIFSFGPKQSEFTNRWMTLDFQSHPDATSGIINEARIRVDATNATFEVTSQNVMVHQGQLPLERKDVLKAFEAMGVPHANTTAYRDADELVSVIGQATQYASVAKIYGYDYQATSSSTHFLASNDNW